MKRVLALPGYYLPGYKGGGPIRSLANLVESLGDEICFYILTQDRDLGDRAPYPDLTPDVWQRVGKAQVMYVSPPQMTVRNWPGLLAQAEYDLVYLNSFFSLQTRLTLLLRRSGKLLHRPVVLAPRGEFSPGALGLRSLKKKLYIQTVMRMGLYDDLVWHATSATEIADMRSVIGRFIPDLTSRTVLAPNLAAPSSVPASAMTSSAKQPGSLRIVFLARVARMKNLDYALAVVRGLSGGIEFDIYGPLEDARYWEECQQIILSAAPNIQITYRGSLPPDQVPAVLAGYHLFFLPTRGENFGHAIIEALAAGCPVLISDQTSWRALEEKGIGWDLPLSDQDRFRQVLQQVVAMDQAEFSSWSARARQFAIDWIRLQNERELQVYRRLFAHTS